MKKTIVLLSLTIAITLLIIYALKRENSDSSIASEDRNFALQQDDEIGRIEIYERNLGQIVLSKESSNWLIAGKYPVRKNAIDNLLEVLYGLEIQYIPSPTAAQNIQRDINAIGVKVQIYSPRGKLLRAYQIGAVTPDERGTYMKVMGANQAYVMHLSNLEGSVRGRFLMKEQDWRDRTVLKENADHFKRVTVQYLKNNHESFTIDKSGTSYALNPINQSMVLDPSSANQQLMKNYLMGYETLIAEYIDNKNPKRDSITSLVPFAEITIDYLSGEQKKMTLYPVDDLLYKDQNTISTEGAKSISRYFVDCNWGDFMLVQHRLIGKLLRGYTYFFIE